MSSIMTADAMRAAELTRHAPYVWQPNSGDLRTWTNLTEITAPLSRVPRKAPQIPVRELLAREGYEFPVREPQWKTWLLLLAAVLAVFAVAVCIDVIRSAAYTPVVSPDVPVETLVRAPGGVR